MSRTSEGVAHWARRVVIAVGVFCSMATVAYAVPITYTLTGTGTGSLGATPFAGAAVTITAVGDTAGVNYLGGVVCNPLTSVTFNIAGIGTGSITDALLMFNAGFPSVAFGRALPNCFSESDWISMGNAVFAGYDVGTSIGPVSLGPLDASAGSVGTSLGGALFFSGFSVATFQATRQDPIQDPIIAIPTLSDYALLGLAVLLSVLGFAALGARRL
jgi:hypothetical protein